MKKWMTIALAAAAGVVVLVSAGTWLYINVIREPPAERLTLDAVEDAPAPTTAAPASTDSQLATSVGADGVDGTWMVSDGSQAGYRVAEILNGQSTEAVGRTSDITGELTIDGTRATAATFTVDMTTVASDESRRDGQFRGRIMDVASHPTSTFALTSPIDFKEVPADGARLTAEATGRLTLKGVTKMVTFDVEGERSGATLRLVGAIPIAFADYGIDDPSGGPAQVGDDGELEFLLVLSR